MNLNTSYVKVQQVKFRQDEIGRSNLNTSYVKVQLRPNILFSTI